MGRMRYYFNLYKGFLATSFAIGTSFRTNFVLLILMDLFFYASALTTTSFIFDHVQQIGPWNRSQFLFFVAFMLAVDHLHMTFVSENFWGFSFDLRTGKLDFDLLRPAGSIFSVFFRDIRASTLFNFPVPWVCLIWFGMKAGMAGLDWILLPFFVLLAFALLVALEVLLCMAMFWTVESWGINFLRMQFQQVSRWPDFVYLPSARRILTFVFPILMVGSVPVHVLFDHEKWPLLLLMVMAIVVVAALIRFFWRRGLWHYESASS